MRRSCTECKKWIVKNANYCWHCGFSFKANTFETTTTELDRDQSGIQPANQIVHVGLIFGASWLGAIWLDWAPALSVIPPLGYLIGLPFLEAYLAAPKPALKPDKTTLKVEYKSEDSRHWAIDNYPDEITFAHLQHVARRVILEQKSFSRRNICKGRIMSQESYRILHGYWQTNNLLIVRPNNHNILTERCRRLLKKALPCPVG